MAKCPKCKSYLFYLKVAFLMPNDNSINCENCNSYLLANPSLLSKFGAIGGGLATYFFILTGKLVKRQSDYWIYTLVITFVILAVYSMLQYLLVDFTIGERPVENESENKFKKAPSRFNRIEYVKYVHHRKSIAQLNEILSHQGWTDEAKKAISELIEEKSKNIT